MPKITLKMVDRALNKIRRLYETGAKSLKNHPQPLRQPQPMTTAKEKLYKAREFAGLYNDDELEALLERCRQRPFILGYAHVARLLSVKKRAARVAIQWKMVKDCWGVRQLSLAILKRQGYIKPGIGRRGRISADLGEGLCRLEQLYYRWKELHRQVRKRLEGRAGREAAEMRRLSQRLEAVEQAMSQLVELVNSRRQKEMANPISTRPKHTLAKPGKPKAAGG